MSHLSVIRDLQSSSELSVMSLEQSSNVTHIPLIPLIVDVTKYDSDNDIVNACSPFEDSCHESFDNYSDSDSDLNSDESSIDVLDIAVIHDDDDPIILDLRRSQEKAETLHCLNKKRRKIQCRIVGELLQQVTEMIKPI